MRHGVRVVVGDHVEHAEAHNDRDEQYEQPVFLIRLHCNGRSPSTAPPEGSPSALTRGSRRSAYGSWRMGGLVYRVSGGAMGVLLCRS